MVFIQILGIFKQPGSSCIYLFIYFNVSTFYSQTQISFVAESFKRLMDFLRILNAISLQRVTSSVVCSAHRFLLDFRSERLGWTLDSAIIKPYLCGFWTVFTDQVQEQYFLVLQVLQPKIVTDLWCRSSVPVSPSVILYLEHFVLSQKANLISSVHHITQF